MSLFNGMRSARSRGNSIPGRGPIPWLGLGLLLLAPGGVVLGNLGPEIALAAGAGGLTASAVTYLLYAVDKRRAAHGGRRIPESTLQLGALVGGWPGAFAAQHRLRHKTAKPGFLLVFWLIVALHQIAALDCLLGWPLRDNLVATLRS